MSHRLILTSVTRDYDLAEGGFRVDEVDRGRWADGDFVVGALGRREATLEATGSWEEVAPARRMHVLSGGGVIGRMTSRAVNLSPLVPFFYRGGAISESGPVRMRPRRSQVHPPPGRTPTVLLVGTSMSAGKPKATQVIVRRKEAFVTLDGTSGEAFGR